MRPSITKSFSVDGEVYDIPSDKVDEFLKAAPHAKEVQSFTVKDEVYDIPSDQVDAFLKAAPDAQPLKKKESTEPMSGGSSDGLGPVSQGSPDGGIPTVVTSDVNNPNAPIVPDQNLTPLQKSVISASGPDQFTVDTKGLEQSKSAKKDWSTMTDQDKLRHNADVAKMWFDRTGDTNWLYKAADYYDKAGDTDNATGWRLLADQKGKENLPQVGQGDFMHQEAPTTGNMFNTRTPAKPIEIPSTPETDISRMVEAPFRHLVENVANPIQQGVEKIKQAYNDGPSFGSALKGTAGLLDVLMGALAGTGEGAIGMELFNQASKIPGVADALNAPATATKAIATKLNGGVTPNWADDAGSIANFIALALVAGGVKKGKEIYDGRKVLDNFDKLPQETQQEVFNKVESDYQENKDNPEKYHEAVAQNVKQAKQAVAAKYNEGVSEGVNEGITEGVKPTEAPQGTVTEEPAQVDRLPHPDEEPTQETTAPEDVPQETQDNGTQTETGERGTLQGTDTQVGGEGGQGPEGVGGVHRDEEVRQSENVSNGAPQEVKPWTEPVKRERNWRDKKAMRQAEPTSLKSLILQLLTEPTSKSKLDYNELKRYTGVNLKELPETIRGHFSESKGENVRSMHSLWESLREQYPHLVPESDHDFKNALRDIVTDPYMKDRESMWNEVEKEVGNNFWQDQGFRSREEYDNHTAMLKDLEQQGKIDQYYNQDVIYHVNNVVDNLTDEQVDAMLADLDSNAPKSQEELNKLYEQYGTEQQPTEPTAEQPQAETTPAETPSTDGETEQPKPKGSAKQINDILDEIESVPVFERAAVREKLKQFPQEEVDAVIKEREVKNAPVSSDKHELIGKDVSFSEAGRVKTGTVKDVNDGVATIERTRGGKTEMFQKPIDEVVSMHKSMGVVPFAPYLKEFIENDVAPVLKEAGVRLGTIGKGILNAISPATGVKRAVKDLMWNMKGEREKATVALSSVIDGFEKTFGAMKDQDRIDFIDRIKTGQKQPTPELQQAHDLLRSLDDEMYAELIKYKPELAWKENHYRVMWKKVPGEVNEKGVFMGSRRPLRGTRGFMKKSTLPDMSEGIARGGVPISTNPFTLFKYSYNDAMKYVTAQKMWESLGKSKMRKFVRIGGTVPDGFVKLDDNIARVYFPTKEGLVNTGEWYIDEGAGRLLNNFLSRDLLRENTGLGMFGKSLLGLKNAYTAVELSLSPFHLVAEGIEAMSSKASLGFRKIVNSGDVIGGAKDIFSSPWSAVDTAQLGGKAIKYMTKEEFRNSQGAKEFLSKVPDAEKYIDLLFQGGGKLSMDESYKIKTIQTLKEQAGKDNYIGAALRAMPAINEALLQPLFEIYIPRLKVGMFMQEIQQALRENKYRIDKGYTTEAEIARKTWNSIEDRLGEMNFDNLWWDRTFKTAMQIMFRSVTWKLGNLRAMGGALPEQGMEFVNAFKEGRRPMLAPKMAWLFGLSAVTAAIGYVTQKAYTGRDPESIKDLIAPQIDKEDPDQRVVVPTYWKDAMHLQHSPGTYLSSSLSGMFGKVYDAWTNKDFYNYQIYDPSESAAQKAEDIASYVVPKPFSFTSAQKMYESGEPLSKSALSFMGFLKAPGYITHPDIENEIFDRFHVYNMDVKPKSQKEGDDKKKEIMAAYNQGDTAKAEQLAADAVKSGLLRQTQVEFLFRNMGSGSDPSKYMLEKLPETERMALWNKMTDEEKLKYGWSVHFYPQQRAQYFEARIKAGESPIDIFKDAIKNNVDRSKFMGIVVHDLGKDKVHEMNQQFKAYLETPEGKAFREENHKKNVARHKPVNELRKALNAVTH